MPHKQRSVLTTKLPATLVGISKCCSVVMAPRFIKQQVRKRRIGKRWMGCTRTVVLAGSRQFDVESISKYMPPSPVTETIIKGSQGRSLVAPSGNASCSGE